jgi:hypothetical protein
LNQWESIIPTIWLLSNKQTFKMSATYSKASASACASASCSKDSYEITPGEVMMPKFSSEEKMVLTVFDSLGLSDAQLEAAFHAMEEYKYKTSCHAISKATGKECGKQLKDGKCPTHKANIFPVMKAVVPKCNVEINGDGENGLPKVCGKKCADGSRFCAVHAKVRETPDGGCDHVYAKGDKSGERCGKKCVEDSMKCKAHKASEEKAQKKAAEPNAAKPESKAAAKPVAPKEKGAAVVIAEEKLSILSRVPLKYYVIKNTPLCVDHTKLNIVGWFEDPTVRADQNYDIKFEWHPYIPAYLEKFGKAYGLKTDLEEPADEIEEEEEVMVASQ